MRSAIRSIWAVSLCLPLLPIHARAQELSVPIATLTEELPDSPGAAMQSSRPLGPTVVGTASVQGVVLDDQGSPVPGAKVTILARGKFSDRETDAGQDGSFSFTALPAEEFRLVITASGFQTFLTPDFNVRAGEVATAPKLALRVASTTSSVDVTASSEQIADAQVGEQEKQRVLGIFPNFYTSYIWKAEPMTTRQKFKLAGRSLIDPFSILIVTGIAGAEQFNGTYPDYGPGIAGYGKRFGAAEGDSISGRMIGSAILPTVLHQDPRYFYQGSGSVTSRSLHAIGSTFLCRGDNGKRQINYSHLGGSLAAGAIANSYHPPASRGLGLTFETFGITTGSNMIGNLIREFVFRHLEPTVPIYANGK